MELFGYTAGAAPNPRKGGFWWEWPILPLGGRTPNDHGGLGAGQGMMGAGQGGKASRARNRCTSLGGRAPSAAAQGGLAPSHAIDGLEESRRLVPKSSQKANPRGRFSYRGRRRWRTLMGPNPDLLDLSIVGAGDTPEHGVVQARAARGWSRGLFFHCYFGRVLDGMCNKWH